MRRLRAAAVAAAFLACSPLATAPPIAPGDAAPDSGEAAPAQTLYRVRYDGPEGDGSLRLVLRQAAAERFQLQASDTFGRAVWSLDLDGDRTLVVDHRRRQACVAGRRLRVPEVALRPLPLPAVARVLAARTPLEVPPGADRSDWTDDAGQRWTARWEEGRVASWMLWQDGRPQLWWSRQPGGGVLSHRDGSQFRWREVAREELPASAYRPLEAPADYDLGTCETDSEAS